MKYIFNIINLILNILLYLFINKIFKNIKKKNEKEKFILKNVVKEFRYFIINIIIDRNFC